ncbi:MAG TPA: hypothetical protein PLE30_05585 [Candidatus Kapabacteria bacterium]|nr:hypothetical protein [Candidatus Kapabacteria bacterium]
MGKKTLPITNILLSIFAIISFLIIIFIKLLDYYLFPNPLSFINTNGFNDSFVNLAYGYISGLFLYLLTTVFANYIKGKNVRNSIQPDINMIIKEHYIILKYFKVKYKITNKDESLLYSDFNNIKTFSNEKMNFRYWFNDNKCETTITGEYSEIEYFKLIKNETIKIIDNIFMIPFSVFIDDKLILILRNLKNCQLFKDAEGLISFEIQNFDKHFHEYCNLIQQLRQYSTINIVIDGELSNS